MLPEKTEKKEGIKLDFHNIGNMKNSKSKLQGECNFFRQHGKSFMQVQIVKIIRKSAEKYRGQSSPDSDMKNAVVGRERARVAIMQSVPNPAGGIVNLICAARGKLCEESPLVRRAAFFADFFYSAWTYSQICPMASS